MTVSGVITAVAVGAFVLALALVALDRRRLQHRLHRAEATVAGLTLDLEAGHEKIAELQRFLGEYDSWAADTEVPVPAHLRDRRPPDRWTPRPLAPSSTSRATAAAPDLPPVDAVALPAQPAPPAQPTG